MKEKDFNIVIVGGGSTYTPGIVKALLEKHDQFPFSTIMLYDNDSVRNLGMKQLVQYMLNQEELAEMVTLQESTDPKVAFKDADFIFSQIRVGGFEMREQDEKIPLKYGVIGQETCGLGGFAYGLRSIKGFLEVLAEIEKYAPDAWVLNYTNPEALISEAVSRKFPHLKVINACDMTISIEETIAINYGYNRDNWVPTYYGLNHFGWYSSIYDKELERDVMPEIIERLINEGMQVADFNAGDQTWQDAWDLMRIMTTDFPEYLPNNYLSYYLYSDLNVEKINPDYTRANYIMDNRFKNTEDMIDKVKNHSEGNILNFNFGSHGQYIVDMAISIIHDDHQRYMLIVQNNGAIPNLRSDAMVEIPAYVGRSGVEPIRLGFDINDFHKGLMEAQNAAEKLLVDAYFEGSYNKALQAFTLNRSVPSVTIAKKILDDFIEANGDYWPTLN